MALTEEGLYISFIKLIKKQNANLINNKLQLENSNAISELVLADSDYYRITENKQLEETQIIECLIIQNMLNIFSYMNNEFIKIKGQNKQQLIIYSKNNNLFIPTCIDVNKMTIYENSKQCYNGVPVGIWIDGKEIRGFYLPSGVIAETTTLNNCNTQQTIHITEINKTIERSNMNYKIVEKEKNEEKINMFNFNPLETIQHFDLIKEGVNVLDKIRKEENILLKNFMKRNQHKPK